MIGLSSPAPSEPEVVFQYYMAIQKVQVGEEDLTSTSAQCIVSEEFLNKISSQINKVKANIAGRSFKDKYSIRATASYNRIMARDMVL